MRKHCRMSAADLHRRLHRADVVKDAKRPDIRINQGPSSDFFNACADELFGPLPQMYVTELSEIKQIVDTSAKIQHSRLFPRSRIPVSMLRHTSDQYVAYLPTQVQYALQDSGLSPKHFKEDITYVVTPAAYIDVAGRSMEPRMIYVGFGHTIPKRDFVSLGFRHIESFSAVLDDRGVTTECVTTLRLTFGRPLVTRFGDDTIPYEGDVLPFQGNNEKNRWFNTVRRYTRDIKHVGMSLIIGKELGDTLQAYYGKLLAQRQGANKVCVFTSDTVLATRCRLMELPVVILDHTKSTDDMYECAYYPAPGIVDAEIVHVFETIVLSHNADVKQTIDAVLREGSCIVRNTRRLRFNDAHRSFLTQIKTHIDAVNVQCRALKREIETTFLTIDEYRKAVFKYLVPYYFQHVGARYHANTSIRVGHTNFEERLLATQSGGGGDGGEGIDDDLSETVFESIEYTKYGDDLMYELSFANQLKRRIYMILFDISKQPKHILVPETERIFDYLFRMFTYLGESTLNFSLLRKLLAAYALRGESLQHEAFASLYFGEGEDKHSRRSVRTTTRRRARRTNVKNTMRHHRYTTGAGAATNDS